MNEKRLLLHYIARDELMCDNLISCMIEKISVNCNLGTSFTLFMSGRRTVGCGSWGYATLLPRRNLL